MLFSPLKSKFRAKIEKVILIFPFRARAQNSYIFQLFEFSRQNEYFCHTFEFFRQNIKNLIYLNFRSKNKQNLFLHRIRNVVGYSRFSLKGSNCPKSASIQDFGLTRIPYLLKFSKDNRIPPRQSNKNAQLTNPEKK